MEIREGEFANSVGSVAKELLGQKYDKDLPHWERDFYYPYLWIDQYLPKLHKVMGDIYSDDSDQPQYAHRIIKGLSEGIDPGIEYASESVSWTIAAAILNDDEKLSRLDAGIVRFLFDLSLGVAIDDLEDRHKHAKRNTTYTSDPAQKTDLMWHSNHHKKRAQIYEALQEKLRQPISDRSNPERG